MKKLILTVATAAILTSAANAPADARNLMRMKPNAATIALVATAAAIAADSFVYGPSYGHYVAPPAPLVFGAPVDFPARAAGGYGYRF
jgi:hypothetical protein